MKVVKKVPLESVGVRADRFLADAIDSVSRSRLKTLFAEGQVTVDGHVCDPDRKVALDEEYSCNIPDPRPTEILAENIPLKVVHEDPDILVIDKPAGLVVHPAAGHRTGTLVNALLAYCDDLPVINGEQRPGIVHRLDKDTSGLIVVARNDAAMRGMQELFKAGEVNKVYAAIVRGLPQGKGRIESEIGRSRRDRKRMASLEKGGRRAVTEYLILEALNGYSLIEVKIETGRTHQIRVHMSEAGHPVAGDATYGGRRSGRAKGGPEAFRPKRHMLHAWKLRFPHPVTGVPLALQAGFPPDFEETLQFLRGKG